jgi:very-short-patch-repair endonuclease
MELRSLDTYGREHHGLITRSAWLRMGYSTTGWYRACAGDLLEMLYPNVARLYGAATTREQAIAAAVLAAGEGAVASHRSAAHLWGIPRPEDDPVDVLLVERIRRCTLDGFLAHRPRDLLDLKPVLRAGIRTTNVLRMLCDLGAVDAGAVAGAVGHVVTAGLASPVALRRAIERHARRGRHGVPAFRNALDDWVIDGKPVDSLLEPAMQRLLARHGLPPAEFHAVIGGYEVDFWIPGTPVVLECDGWEHHGRDRRQFEADRVRDAELVGIGYITVRFTYRQLTRRPGPIATQIRRILARWAPSSELGTDRAGG